MVAEETSPATNFALLAQQLPRQTPRWCHLTTVLLSLVVLDSQRSVEANSLSQFLDVIHWRAHGKITGEEFSILYNEWIVADSKKTEKKKPSLSLAGLRAIVLEKKYLESDLDLFIGILLHETNTRMLNSTISFGNKKAYPRSLGSNGVLEVVTEKWLSLAEELFFCLDTPGYGALRFEEIFFLSASLLVGMQSWRSEAELEADLSLISLTTITAQFLRDCGASPPTITSRQTNILDMSYPPKANIKSPRSPVGGKQEVTLSMFKKYLVKKAVGEQEIVLLIANLRRCIDILVRLTRQSGAEDLALSCQPYELRGAVQGGPRLWQEAVLIASGFLPPHSTSNGTSSPTLPPILLYLLSDAEKAVSLSFRAIEFSVNDDEFVDGQPDRQSAVGSASSQDISNPVTALSAANEELHDNASRLYRDYRKWVGSRGKDTTALLMMEMQRDPVYKLIFSTLLQYKRMQALMNAALFDLCVGHFGVADGISHSPLSVLCANLLPNNKDMLIELGLEDAPEDPSKALSPNIYPNDFTGGSGGGNAGQRLAVNDLEDTPMASRRPSTTSRRQSAGGPVASTVVVGLPKASGYDGMETESATSASTGTEKRISSLPAAAKRRSSLLDQGTPAAAATSSSSTSALKASSQPSTGSTVGISKFASTTPAAPPSTTPLPPAAPSASSTAGVGAGQGAGSAKASGSKKEVGATPNYLKPTTTFAARTRPEPRNGESSADDETPDRGSKLAASKTSSGRLGHDSIDSEASSAEWKPILDMRGARGLGGGSAPPSASSSTGHPARSSGASNAGAPMTGSSMVAMLAEQEAQILNMLLTASDAAEQTRLIEQLRHIKMKQQGLPSQGAVSSAENNNPSSHLNRGSSSSNQVFQQQAATAGSQTHRHHSHRAAGPASSSSMGMGDVPPPPPPPPSSLNTSTLVIAGSGSSDPLSPQPPFQGSSYHYGRRAEASSAQSEAASSSIPSSIAEMLQQGQSPGRYAAMLRDILRRMSRDDSKVRIKSLEQVLALGQEIVRKETLASPTSPNSPPRRYSTPNNTLRDSSSSHPLSASVGHSVVPESPYSTVSSLPTYASATGATSGASSGHGSTQVSGKVILRATKAPGTMPDRNARKNARVSLSLFCSPLPARLAVHFLHRY